MPTKTTTKPGAKELMNRAKALGIKGVADMGLAELRDAVENAERKETKAQDAPPAKTKTAKAAKKAPATKKKASKPAPAKSASAAKKKAAPAKAEKKERPRTAGGTGATKDSVRVFYPPAGVTPATEKVNPFRKGSNLFAVVPLLFKGGNRTALAEKLSEKVELHPYHKEEIDLLDYDKRILLGAQTLRDKFGFGIVRTGRGIDGTVKVFVPGSGDDPASKGSKKASSKKPAKA